MALLATSCTMRNKPSRLLDKGPEYLRTRTNSQLFETRRLSAVELLAASRSQYVKSQTLLHASTSAQDLAVPGDRPSRSPRRRARERAPPRSKSEYDISRIPLDEYDDVDAAADSPPPPQQPQYIEPDGSEDAALSSSVSKRTRQDSGGAKQEVEESSEAGDGVPAPAQLTCHLDTDFVAAPFANRSDTEVAAAPLTHRSDAELDAAPLTNRSDQSERNVNAAAEADNSAPDHSTSAVIPAGGDGNGESIAATSVLTPVTSPSPPPVPARRRARRLFLDSESAASATVTPPSAIAPTERESESGETCKSEAGVTSSSVITLAADTVHSRRPVEINSASHTHHAHFPPDSLSTDAADTTTAVTQDTAPVTSSATTPTSAQPPPLPPKPARLKPNIKPKPPAKPPKLTVPKPPPGAPLTKPVTPAISTGNTSSPISTADTASPAADTVAPVSTTKASPPPVPPNKPAIYTAKPVYITLASTTQSVDRCAGGTASATLNNNHHTISTITVGQKIGVSPIMSEDNSDKTPTNPTCGDVDHGMNSHAKSVPTPQEDSATFSAAYRERDRSNSRGDVTPDASLDDAVFESVGNVSALKSADVSNALDDAVPKPRGPLQVPISELSSGLGYPVPRSFSDISCHHSRAGSDVSSEASRASRTSRASRASAGANLEKFFNEMGMEKDVLDPLLRRQQRQFEGSERDIYESVSSLDSHEARSICSALSRSEREISASSDAESIDRSQQQTSIVERNARIIKWLCSVKKAKQGPAGFQGSAS